MNIASPVVIKTDLVWKILIIDDDEDDYLITKEMLNDARGKKYEVQWASTYQAGQEALLSGSYNAVLVDYDLGLHSGIELIREANERGYHTPLILFTGRGNYEIDVEAMQAGATLYLTKGEANSLLLERSIRYAIERKQTEAALLERDRKLSVALAAAQLGTWIYTFKDDMLEMDERAKQIYRASGLRESHEVLVKNLLHPADIAPMQAALRRAADPDGDGRYQAEYRIVQPDGAYRWIRAWGLADYEGQGAERRAVRLTGASRDFTWEKQASLALEETNTALRTQSAALGKSEQSLKEMAGRFQSVLETSLDAAYRRDLQTDRYDYMSPVIEQVLGFTAQEMMMMGITETLSRIHPEDLTVVESGMARSEEQGKARLVYRFRCKDDRYRWVADYVTVTKDAQGKNLFRTGILRDVTEQVNAQRALRASEERFRLASRAVAGVLYDWSIDREEMYQSEGLERVVGYRPGEEPGGSKDWWPRNIHPEDYLRIQAALQAVIAGPNDSFSYEYRIRHKDGHWVHIWDQGHIVRDERGQARRVVGMCTDISGRVKVEEELRKSSTELLKNTEALQSAYARLRFFVDANIIGVIMAKEDGRITESNDYFLNLLGYTRSEFEAGLIDWRKITPQEYLPGDEHAITELKEYGICTPYEKEFTHKDGSRVWVYLIDALIPDGTIASYVLDISERKRAEEVLRKDEAEIKLRNQALIESEKRLRRLVEGNIIGINIRDVSGQIQDANEAFLDMIGFTREDLQAGALKIPDLTPPAFHNIDDAAIQEALVDGACKPYEKEYTHRDGHSIPAMVGYTRLDDNEERFIGYVLDLSELKQAQAALQDYAEKLKHSNQELEQFAFVASHDLQEPLRKVVMFSESLKRHSGDALDETASDYLNRMQNAAERMQAMINGLLDLSRISTRGSEFTSVNLSNMVDEVVSDLEPRIQEVAGQVQAEILPTITADAMQMRQLFQNLIGNAIKFHKPGVAPLVHVTGKITQSCKKQMVEIRLEDNGIGFEQEYAEQIFKPFQRLHGRGDYEGTGLGLAICQKIVDRHQGRITVQSAPGLGTTFIVQLPVKPSEPSA